MLTYRTAVFDTIQFATGPIGWCRPLPAERVEVVAVGAANSEAAEYIV